MYAHLYSSYQVTNLYCKTPSYMMHLENVHFIVTASNSSVISCCDSIQIDHSISWELSKIKFSLRKLKDRIRVSPHSQLFVCFRSAVSPWIKKFCRSSRTAQQSLHSLHPQCGTVCHLPYITKTSAQKGVLLQWCSHREMGDTSPHFPSTSWWDSSKSSEKLVALLGRGGKGTTHFL